jgi:hypothetical protein
MTAGKATHTLITSARIPTPNPSDAAESIELTSAPEGNKPMAKKVSYATNEIAAAATGAMTNPARILSPACGVSRRAVMVCPDVEAYLDARSSHTIRLKDLFAAPLWLGASQRRNAVALGELLKRRARPEFDESNNPSTTSV